MKSRLAAILLFHVCLFAFIGGVVYAPGAISHETEEIVLFATTPAAETTVQITEPAIPETTMTHTEPRATPPMETTVLPTTVPDVTESIKEQKDQGSDLRSLGTFTLTAYCSCQKCCGNYALNRPVDENGNEIVYGSIGVRLEAGVSIAVDPRVIPYKTQVVINGHTYIAHDTGGSIKGNRIDVYFEDHQEARNFGIKNAEVFVYEAS